MNSELEHKSTSGNPKYEQLKVIEDYLLSTKENFFADQLSVTEQFDKIVMWIDWREEDENIIIACEEILNTSALYAVCTDAENDRGFDITITFQDEEIIIPYKGTGADRDTTIQTLNKILLPDYEIRLFQESTDGDTLCFLPLSAKQWFYLDSKFSKSIEKKFTKISGDAILFG